MLNLLLKPGLAEAFGEVPGRARSTCNIETLQNAEQRRFHEPKTETAEEGHMLKVSVAVATHCMGCKICIAEVLETGDNSANLAIGTAVLEYLEDTLETGDDSANLAVGTAVLEYLEDTLVETGDDSANLAVGNPVLEILPHFEDPLRIHCLHVRCSHAETER